MGNKQQITNNAPSFTSMSKNNFCIVSLNSSNFCINQTHHQNTRSENQQAI